MTETTTKATTTSSITATMSYALHPNFRLFHFDLLLVSVGGEPLIPEQGPPLALSISGRVRALSHSEINSSK